MRALVLLVLMAAPGPALAQSQTPERSLQIVASAPSVCRMAPPAVTGNASYSADSGGGVLQLSELVNDDGVSNPLRVALSLEVICTGPHSVSVLSAMGGIVNSDGTGGAGAGFASRLDYQLDGAWAGGSFGFATAGAPVSASLNRNGPARGSFDLDLSFAGGQRLVAGEYADELTVTINPE